MTDHVYSAEHGPESGRPQDFNDLSRAMRTASDLAAGGYVPGPRVLVALDDDECVLDNAGRCTRSDDRHLRDTFELQTFASPTGIRLQGACLHRACHVEPVESVTGELVAYLCRGCDQQLP